MNAEQEKHIEEIRAATHGQGKYRPQSLSEAQFLLKLALADRATLLAIVDDLRKHLPKQLNGGEVMAECFQAYEVKHDYDSFASGWLAAFRRMGAIKE